MDYRTELLRSSRAALTFVTFWEKVELRLIPKELKKKKLVCSCCGRERLAKSNMHFTHGYGFCGYKLIIFIFRKFQHLFKAGHNSILCT